MRRASSEDATTTKRFLRRRSTSMTSVDANSSSNSNSSLATRIKATMNNHNNPNDPNNRPKKVLRFGTTTVHTVDKIPAEEQSFVWYNKAELEVLYAAEVEEMKECEKQCWKKSTTKCDSHTRRGLQQSGGTDARHKHVRHVIAIFRMQQRRHQGYWDPQSLRRVSKFASKDNRRVAVKRAKKDYMDAHDKGLLSSIMSRVSLAA